MGIPGERSAPFAGKGSFEACKWDCEDYAIGDRQDRMRLIGFSRTSSYAGNSRPALFSPYDWALLSRRAVCHVK